MTMMVISLFPVGVLSEKMKCAIPVASAKTYATGDIIEFGGYPQSRVTDSTTVDALDGLSKNWHSYSYYSGTGELSDGKMQPGDWMRYADVIYNDDKYRAVTFDTYRPDNTGYKTQYSTENTYQAANGYTVGTTYYFKWESLKWRVLNPATGLVISEKLIDSQAYQNTIYCANNYVNNEHWQNQTQSIYANDYTASSIRNWLIKDFYNSAFSFSEQVLIKEADLDNSAFSDSYSQYNSTSTTDKIFLLSYGDMINTAYGFSSSFSDNDTKRRAQGTDYAKCQGLGVYSEGDYAGNSHWRLRSPGPYSFSAAYVDYTGCVHDDDVVICTHFGVRPAFQFKSGISESANSKGGTQFTVDYEAEGGTEGPYAQTKYEGVTLELSTKIPNKSYTLTYNANRGTVSSPSITRSCIFNSWNTKTDGSGTEYGPGDEYLDDADITLYAQWEKPVAGELESPTCEGYIFDGWYTAEDGGEKVTETFEVTEDITIYAHWIEEPDEFTVRYDTNGGKGTPEDQIKTEGTDLTLREEIPVKDYVIVYDPNGGSTEIEEKTVDCTFINWNNEPDGRGTAYYPKDEYTEDADITLYAQWKNPVAGMLEEPTRDGHIFDGWYTAEDGGEEITESFEVTENITVYAHWAKELNEFTVNYDANGGDGAPEDQIKTEGTDLTISEDVPVKDFVITYDPTGGSIENEEKTVGCTFLDWNCEPDGSGTAYAPGDEYTDDADITLYAQWENPVAGELEEPTREGYLFDGWHTAEDGGEEIAESFEVTEDITVYSHWVKELSEFTVSYDANGGVEAPEDQIKTEGTDLTLSDGIPVKDYVITYDLTDGSTENEEKTVNCSFINWNSASDGSGTAYAPGGEYSDDADVTLYAQWENPVAGVLEDPTKDGYVFDGWYTAEDGGEKIAETFEISEDVTVYAHWIPEENPDSLAGDINGDGVVNNKDLTRLMKYLSGEDVYVVKKALDVNGDGICNNKDLTRLMKYLAGVDVKIYYDKNAREFEKIYYVPVRVSTQSEAGTNEQALWQWEESNVSISLNDEKSPERVRSILFDGDGRLLSASGTDTVFEIECGVRYEFKYNDAVLDSVVRTKEPLQQMDNAADYITTSTLLFNENGLLSKYTTEEDTSFSDYLIEYDESGRVVSISGKDSGGSINFTYSYNNDRYDSAETDYYVQTDVSEYHYNEEGKLIRVEQEDGNIEYDYDEHGNVTGIKNEVIGNMEIQIEYEPATHAQYQAFLAIMNCNLDFVTPNEKITSFYRGFLMN